MRDRRTRRGAAGARDLQRRARAERGPDRAVGAAFPHGCARHLRPARELGSPLLRRALSGAGVDRRADRRPRGRAARGGGAASGRRGRPGARPATPSPPTCASSLLLVFLCGLAAGLVMALAVRGRRGPAPALAVRAPRSAPRWRALSRSSCCCRRAARSRIRSTTPTARTSRSRCARSSRRRAPRATISEELERAARRARPAGVRLVAGGCGATLPRRGRGLGPPQQPARAAGARTRGRLAAAASSSGDLTSSGSPFEFSWSAGSCGSGTRSCSSPATTTPTRSYAGSRSPGDRAHRARAAARGRRPTGRSIVRVRGVRVAGYADPFERRASERFRGRGEPRPTAAQREEFRDWLRPLLGRVDVVMVHEPALAEDAAARAAAHPPARAARARSPATRTCSSFRSSTNFAGAERRDRRRRRYGQPREEPAVRPRGADLHARGRLRADARPTSSRSTPTAARRGPSAHRVAAVTRRRKHWGWGYEDQQPPARGGRGGRGGRAPAPRLRRRPRSSGRCRWRTSSCPRRGSSRPRSLARDLPQPTPTSAPRTPTASPTATSSARFRGPLRPPARRRRAPPRRGRGRARARLVRGAGAAAIPYGGGTSVVGGVEPPRRRGRAVTIDLRALDRVLEVDRSRAPRGSRPAPRARRSRSSCASTASRCATSRSRSSTRRSAAGSRRARAATSPRSTRTSTTSSSRCARSRRAGVWESRRLPGLGRRPEPRPAC